MANLGDRIQQLVLSGEEIKQFTNWPDRMIEDYLGIIEDIGQIQQEFDQGDTDLTDLEERVLALEIKVTLIQEQILDLQNRTTTLELKAFELVRTSIDMTTKDNQIILCDNVTTINVTLDASPSFSDEVHIKRKGGSVNIIGTVDGKANLRINIVDWSGHFIFNGIDWSLI